jgi:penicillin-binding protein 1A
MVLGVGLLAHHIYFDRSNLPAIDPFIRFELPTVGTVYDAHGEVLFELAREYRRVVKYEEIPPVVRDAILSAEDKNFFTHSGVDYGAFPRVVWSNLARSVRGRRPDSGPDRRPNRGFIFSQGGSTITQQLVRGYFLQSMTTGEEDNRLVRDGFLSRLAARVVGASATNKLLRKMEEVRLSVWLEEEMERRFGSRQRAKEEILARYASFLYMGNGRYGFATASEYYFGKPLSSYTVDDADKAALLAAIVKSPRDYAPVARNVERALGRRNSILDQMVKNHYLTSDKGRLCKLAPIPPDARPEIKTEAPAVIEALFSELNGLKQDRLTVAGFAQGRILVHSTASRVIQGIVNVALENGLREFEKRHHAGKGLIQGSVVVLSNADAGILAESGGRKIYMERNSSYVDLNRASGSRRQPGSAMKPFVYLTAFRMGATLDHDVSDEPISVPDADGEPKWIRNYDDEFKGVIPFRQALAESRNSATTWIAEKVGISEVLKTARDLGIKTPLGPYISTALGASEVRLVELANAYRAMASGIAAEPHGIQRVTDVAGSTLFVADRSARPLELDPAALGEIQEGLRGVVRLPGGTAHSLDSGDFPIPVMGKTGTTSDFRDALFVGSTYGPDGITVAVRVGYDDNRTLGNKETGARTALPIFREIMSEVYARRLAGPVPRFPDEMEQRITAYVACASERALQGWKTAALTPPAGSGSGGGIADLVEGPKVLTVPETPGIPSTLDNPSAVQRCARPGVLWSRALPSTAVLSR